MKKKNINNLEEQIFTWESWDELEANELLFYNCTVTHDVHPYLKKGDKFVTVFWSGSTSTVYFYPTKEDEDDADSQGTLKFKIKITLESLDAE